jgi:hypothetical protein
MRVTAVVGVGSVVSVVGGQSVRVARWWSSCWRRS